MWGSNGVVLVQLLRDPDAAKPRDFASFLQRLKTGQITGSPSWRNRCRSCPAL